MGFSQRVLEYIRAKDLTKSDLARAVGIPYTTLDSMLKRDSDGARLDVIFRIASTLGVTVDELVYGGRAEKFSGPVSEDERTLLSNFRKTDQRGRSSILNLAAFEAQTSAPAVSRTRRARIPVYDAPAAAGAALPLLTESFTMSDTDDIPEKASFGIKISGDSMEPLIADQSVVWVQRVPELYDSEIGIFLLNGESLCKKLDHDENGVCRLVSVNSAYAPIRVLDTDELKVVGRVLLK